jgi:hypothetical protein
VNPMLADCSCVCNKGTCGSRIADALVHPSAVAWLAFHFFLVCGPTSPVCDALSPSSASLTIGADKHTCTSEKAVCL